MNRKEAIEIAERELGKLRKHIYENTSEGLYDTKKYNEGIDQAITLLAEYLMEINDINKQYSNLLDYYPETEQSLIKKNEELQQKLDRAERALLIESSEPEERSQEASHYNWLDDKNEELQQKLDRMEKELVEEKYLNDMASQAKTMT